MLKNQPESSYETEKISITTTIFESMVHNLGKKINRMKVKLQFAAQSDKRDFQRSEQKCREREDVIDLDSDSEDSKEEGQSEVGKNQQWTPSKLTPTGNLKDKIDKRQIPVSFELSCLLKERYMEKLKKIGNILNVRFMVVPNKVKILGYKSELVDEAQEQFGFIQDKIRFTPIPVAGRQIYQSKLYRQILRDHQIEVVKILLKYYFWYEDGIEDPTQILNYVCSKTKHKMISFDKLNYKYEKMQEYREPVEYAQIVHGELQQREFKTSIILDLLSQVKATIFEKYISKEINRLEKSEDRKVELSQDRKNLILHLDADQQISIRQEIIKEYFQPFKYTYLLFDSGTNMSEVEKFVISYSNKGNASFKKNKQSGKPLFYFHIIDNYICLAHLEKEKDAAGSQAENEIMAFFRAMPQSLLTFQLSVRCFLDSPEQDPEFKKFAFEKDRIEKVTLIRCKNPSYKNYEYLFQCYVDEKFNQYKKNQEAELNNAKEDVSVSISVDMSRPIDETSMMFNDTINNSNINITRNVIDTSMMKVLPPEFGNANQPVFKFEDYTFCLSEKPEQRAKRYSDTVDHVKRKQISYSNKQLENALVEQTKSKFKVYKITISNKLNIDLPSAVQNILEKQPDLEKFNRYVTVFYGGKQSKDHQNVYKEDTSIKIMRLVENNTNHIKEGYLLKTNLVFIYLQFLEKKYIDLPFGQYEALYFAKRLE